MIVNDNECKLNEKNSLNKLNRETHVYLLFLFIGKIMARGQQKIQSQQKNAAKQAAAKKSKSHNQKKAAAAALTYICTVCKVRCW